MWFIFWITVSRLIRVKSVNSRSLILLSVSIFSLSCFGYLISIRRQGHERWGLALIPQLYLQSESFQYNQRFRITHAEHKGKLCSLQSLNILRDLGHSKSVALSFFVHHKSGPYPRVLRSFCSSLEICCRNSA